MEGSHLIALSCALIRVCTSGKLYDRLVDTLLLM